MKASAPEKLYYAPYGDIREDNPVTDNDIEYIREDAFIEKAAKWVKERAEMFLLKTPIYDYYDYKKAVMDFRKYMKG